MMSRCTVEWILYLLFLSMQQYLVVLIQDLIGAIGGYLGLFLGWSVMSLVTIAPAWARLLWNFTKNTHEKYTEIDFKSNIISRTKITTSLGIVLLKYFQYKIES